MGKTVKHTKTRQTRFVTQATLKTCTICGTLFESYGFDTECGLCFESHPFSTNLFVAHMPSESELIAEYDEVVING